MEQLKQTIDQARTKGLDDAAIKQLLVTSGWDKAVVEAALLGVFVPAPPQASPAQSHSPDHNVKAVKPDHDHQLSALEAAVHHVLLWFFTSSLTITIAIVSATLFGVDTSITAVSSFLATSVITLLPYGYFYWRYLRQVRRDPSITTGRVWSIITIVLHSLGAMAALITLVVVAINSPEDSLPALVAAAVIAILNVLVVAAYAHATFVVSESRRRRLILKAFPLILVAILAAFIIASIGKVGPLRADEKLRQDMVRAAEMVRDYTKDNQALPVSSSEVTLPDGVTYEPKDTSSYRLCGDFQSSRSEGNSSYDYEPTDDYLSTYNFSNDDAGRQCFTIKSQYMEDQNLLTNNRLKEIGL